MKTLYRSKGFSKANRVVIAQANTIIAEYQAQGLQLTLRQLYYQFVSRDWLPNQSREYNRLSVVISDARLAGLVDWDAIEDRTRNLVHLPTWDSPREIVEIAANQYREDLWADQPNYVEVWVEKEALGGYWGYQQRTVGLE